MVNLSLRKLIVLARTRFLTTEAAISASPQSPVTVDFVTNSCGLPLRPALSIYRKLRADGNQPGCHEAVVAFLKSHGFEKTHVAQLVSKRPVILRSRVENDIKPKFEFLIGNGFLGPLLPELLLSNPKILSRSLDLHLKPAFNLLKEALRSQDRVISAIRRSSWLLTFENMASVRRNIDILRSEGVPSDSILRLMLWEPRTVVEKVKRVEFAVKKVKELGLDPNSPVFLQAVRAMVSMNDSTWSKKVEVLKSLGWSEEDIVRAFRNCPFCLASSEKKIRTVMDFVLNTLKLTPQIVVANPKLLLCRAERLHRRCNVLKALASWKLIREEENVAWLYMMSETDFLKEFVNKHAKEVPGLVEMYSRKVGNDGR